MAQKKPIKKVVIKEKQPSKLVKEYQLPPVLEGIEKLIIVDKDKKVKEVINR